jgi:hypothetical protein
MATAKFADNWVSTLNAPYTAGGTSLTVVNASLLPASGDFYVLVQAEGANTMEVLLVTARSGNVLTVTGAQANTPASHHATGATIQGTILTAGSIAQLKLDIVAGSTPATSMTAAAFDTATANGTVQGGLSFVKLRDGHHDAIWNGSAWEYYHQGVRCYPMVNADFSWINQDSSVISALGKTSYYYRAGGGSDTIRWRAKTISLTPPYQVTAQIFPEIFATGAPMAGIWIGESGSTPKVHTHLATYNGNYAWRSYKWTTPTSFAGSLTYTDNTIFAPVFGMKIWMRIKHDGVNLIFSVSHNGNQFYPLNSSTVGATSFLSNVSQWGVVLNSVNAPTANLVGQLVYSWLEETAL